MKARLGELFNHHLCVTISDDTYYLFENPQGGEMYLHFTSREKGWHQIIVQHADGRSEDAVVDISTPYLHQIVRLQFSSEKAAIAKARGSAVEDLFLIAADARVGDTWYQLELPWWQGEEGPFIKGLPDPG